MPAAFHGRLITDRPTNPTAQVKADMAKEVFAKAVYFRDRDFRIRGLANANQIEINELTDQITTGEVAKGAYARDIERMGNPTRIVGEGDKAVRVRVDWQTEMFGYLVELKARRAALQEKKFPASPQEEIDNWLRRNADGNWRTFVNNYFEGDTRAASVLRQESMAFRKRAEAKVDKIEKSRAHSTDAKRRADASIDRIADKGKPDMTFIFAGYRIMPGSGEYAKNDSPDIEFPKTFAYLPLGS